MNVSAGIERQAKNLSTGAKTMLYFISAVKLSALVLLLITVIKEGFASEEAANIITIFAVILGLGITAQTISAAADSTKAALFFSWTVFIFDCIVFLFFGAASLLTMTSEDKNFTLLVVLAFLMVTIFQLIAVACIGQSVRAAKHETELLIPNPHGD